MASNNVKEPLLSAKIDPMAQTHRRRFRHCKSTPAADRFPQEKLGIASAPCSESILGIVHPSFCKVAIFLAVYLVTGTACFYLVRHQFKGQKTNGIVDAVYLCIVTMTASGYGDLVPNSAVSKLLACAFVFTGVALVGLILSKAADYLVEKQELLHVKALQMHQKVDDTESLEEAGTNRVRYKCVLVFILLSLLIIIGAFFLITVEKLDPVNAFYCVCSTITTLGYGDKSFSTKGGRIFAVFWILTSTICLAQFFLYIAEFNTERRQRDLVKWVLTRKMTVIDLKAADYDSDGKVGLAEFAIYKLKEMGKISQEDISLVMEEFENIDVDQSGTLSESDIVLAQSSPNGEITV